MPPLNNCVNLSSLDFFFSKMGIKTIITAITPLKVFLKNEMSFCQELKTVAGLVIIVVVTLIITNNNTVIPTVTL